MNILVLAFNCATPSASGGIYRTVKALAERDDMAGVTVVSSEDLEIEGAKETSIIDINFLKKPFEGFARWIPDQNSVGRSAKTTLSYPLYIIWELIVWKRYRAQLEAGEFDLIFRAGPASPALPSPIAKRSPVPFIIGPLNGCLSISQEGGEAEEGKADWQHTITELRDKLPYRQSTFKNADAILAAFDHTINDLPDASRERAILFPDAGYDPEQFFPANDRMPADGPMRFIFVGRLSSLRSVDVVLQAFAQFPELQKHHLTIVGSGPEETSLQKFIAKHDLSACVSLTGRLDQADVARELGRAHIFVSAAPRELSGEAVIEAMASGLPCIVIDAGAPATLISAERGLKVPLTPREKMVTAFGEAMLELVGNPERTQALGIAALDYAEGFRWGRKSNRLAEVFRWVMGELDEKPEFY